MIPTLDPGLAAARRLYRILTLAYPSSFRKDYRPLLVQLFCDQYRAASANPERGRWVRFWLHTLGDLVASVGREQADQFRRDIMNHERTGSILLGMLLFVLVGTAVALVNAPVPQEISPIVNIGGLLLWLCSYLLVLGLLLKGWLAGFPPWVYPYLGYAFIFPLYMSFAATPGLELFGVPLWGRELWGWRAFVPLGLVVLLALILSRPPRGNLVRLFRNAWEDWTLAAFSLFGMLPLVVFVSMDEVEHSFAFWPQLAGILLTVLGAFLYLRLAHPGMRYLALLACTFLAVAVISASAGYYWETHSVNFTTGVSTLLTSPVDWLAVLLKAATEAGLMTMLLLLPLSLVGARHANDWFDAHGPRPAGDS